MAKRNDPLRQVISSPAAFRTALRIDTDSGPQPLGSIADPWQRDDYAHLDPAWQRFASHVADPASSADCLQRAYLERPRGHSKTCDIAQYGGYAVAASPRTIYGVWAAADKEQARLSRDTVAAFVRNNPWLSKLLDVQAYKIVNRMTGSTLEIISSDAATSYGITPDFIVCDELTHWKNQDLWVSLLSSAAKKSNCILLIIANAGLGQGSSWQWLVREGCRLDPDWIFSRLDGPRASWISPKLLGEQARLLPPAAYRRLWLNEWTSSAGDALEQADIRAACTLDGPLPRAEERWSYFAGVDIGVRRNFSGLAVVGRNPAGRLKLAYLQSWAPQPNRGDVNLEEVENAILDVQRRFRIRVTGYDPNQCYHLAQRLNRRGVSMYEVGFTPTNLSTMASMLLTAFRSRGIDIWPDPRLVAELSALTIEERPFGFRVVAATAADGSHADLATALLVSFVASKSTAVGSGLPWGGMSAINQVNRWAGYKAPPGSTSMYGESVRKTPFG